MTPDEVFPAPLVKYVHFEIRFPNLFFLEGKIGDFQIAIMREFPKSTLLLRKQFVIARQDEGATADIPQPEVSHKIWRFANDKGVTVDLTTSSLNITSERHITYNLGDSDRFRDTIELVCTSFFTLTKIPLLIRVGLRYVDECPLHNKSTDELKTLLETSFPVAVFPLEDSSAMEFAAVVKRGEFGLRYVESFREEPGRKFINLDFDASAEHINADATLATVDSLHAVIANEFDRVTRCCSKSECAKESDKSNMRPEINHSPPTGSAQPPLAKSLVLQFDPYEIVIAVSESGQIIGVEEVRIKKHFLNRDQIGYIDTDEFYQD